jgi:tetratricopeptide (TPR) repeat protein/tRNA A-37 threonylcarbamoyl transferase component Bud32
MDDSLESNEIWKEGIRSYDAGQLDQALKLFFEVDLCPRSAYNVGIIEMKMEQFEEAKAAFSQALELDPNFTVAYLQLGVCHYILDEIQEARRQFQATLESAKGLPDVDYVHVLLDYALLKEKVEYNLSLCSRQTKSPDEVPFGAPHRLYLPPRNPAAGSSGYGVKRVVDPAVSTRPSETVRPRAQSDIATRTKEVKETRKNRSNSLGEMWERLFHSKKKKNKAKSSKPVDTMYAPISAKKFNANRCFSNSEGDLPSRDPLRRKSLDLVKINYEELQMGAEIGRGSFGSVFTARWRGADCCCKVPTKNHKEHVRRSFIREIDNMRKLIHPNICQFLGVCEEPLCLVIELMSEGSVMNLMNNKSVKLDASLVISIAKQTSCGMLYLHSKGVLHGDLAARNLLYRTELATDGTTRYIIKISDFGLSVLSGDEQDLATRTTFPIRWSAPEVLVRQAMSKASDAWSFGVLLWELLQRAQPFADLSANEVVDRVCKGYRLPRPNRIPYPIELNQLMDTCWLPDPQLRPDFSQIEIMLEIIENSVSSAKSPPRPPRPAKCQGCFHGIEIGDRFCRFCGFQM